MTKTFGLSSQIVFTQEGRQKAWLTHSDPECQRFLRPRILIYRSMDDTSTKALLRVLEEAFPATNPIPTNTYEYIMYRAGQRAVIDYIYQLIEE